MDEAKAGAKAGARGLRCFRALPRPILRALLLSFNSNPSKELTASRMQFNYYWPTRIITPSGFSLCPTQKGYLVDIYCTWISTDQGPFLTNPDVVPNVVCMNLHEQINTNIYKYYMYYKRCQCQMSYLQFSPRTRLLCIRLAVKVIQKGTEMLCSGRPLEF